METKAILRVDDAVKFVDLYLPHDTWEELVKRLGTNKLTVVLRMLYEYTGNLKIEETTKVRSELTCQQVRDHLLTAKHVTEETRTEEREKTHQCLEHLLIRPGCFKWSFELGEKMAKLRGRES